MRPPAGEMERLETLLDAHVGASAASPALQSRPLPVRHVGSSWRLVSSLTVGAVLVGGAAIWSLRPSFSQTHTASAVSAPAPVTPPEVAETIAPVVDAPALVAPEPAPSVKPAPEAKAPAQPARDALAEEVALLSRATRDLRAGRAAAALKSLDEHQRKFPHGMLAVERRAVRAQTLCTLKRVSEGRAELAQLAPQSPAAGRAKQLCDAASQQ
ncbi:MAG TPA: hypothetical protein VFK05_04675 [Polyangiaceae bacterium]|nr:hypothetical protein [Polyangiaceae bacterium]